MQLSLFSFFITNVVSVCVWFLALHVIDDTPLPVEDSPDGISIHGSTFVTLIVVGRLRPSPSLQGRLAGSFGKSPRIVSYHPPIHGKKEKRKQKKKKIIDGGNGLDLSRKKPSIDDFHE